MTGPSPEPASLATFSCHRYAGLWAVSNEWKDVSDLASIKEQRSDALFDRPYRFLQAIDKTVDQKALGVTAAVRNRCRCFWTSTRAASTLKPVIRS